jgi:hypothetical protein
MSDIILTTVAWKRRSGFAQFSDAITGSNSWEKRRLTLHHSTKTKSTRLCYYAIDSKSPRGTVFIKSERTAVWANHHPSDGTQPTPYSLSVLPDGGTKWKFCFEDRNTQYAWLLALSDAVVEGSVKEYNSRILLNDASSWDHGGFHRLYEEGTVGLFESVKDMLLGNREIVGLVLEKSGKAGGSSKKDSSESIEVVGIKKGQQSAKFVVEEMGDDLGSRELVQSAPESVEQTTHSVQGSQDSKEVVGISTDKLYQAFFIVNLSVIYVHLSAQSNSFVAVPWWQLLIAMNAVIYYICLNPKHDETNDSRANQNAPGVKFVNQPTKGIQSNGTISFEDLDEKDQASSVTKSTIRKELLRAEEVPLSDVPMELHQKRVESDTSQQRTEQLSEDEMAAHLHERWAMSAPDCDLSGEWTLIADDSFKAEYDTYLKQLGFNRITRGVACSLIARTTEVTKQSKGGRELYLKGINPKGAWERVLVASGYPDFETHGNAKEGTDYTHMKTSIKTADAEDVNAEAWWEERGTMHRSWLRGGTKYGGGDFESLRYLEDGSNGNVLASYVSTCVTFI